MEAKEFGARLRELRKQAGLSQRELADKIGINFSYLSKIESGVMPPPSEKVILKLAEVLNSDTDELITLAGKVPPDIAQMLKNRETLKLLRSDRIQKKVRASSKREGAIPMSYKSFARIALAIILVVAMGASLWFSAPIPVRAFGISVSVADSPISGNTTYLLGEKVTLPASIQFDALESKDFQSVSINITGDNGISFSKELPIPDAKARWEIFNIHTRGKPLAADVDLKALADSTDGLVGADIEAICRRASMLAIREFLDKHKNFKSDSHKEDFS